MVSPKPNLKVFFVNKFNWLDASPMTTVSTFSTYALASAGVDTHLICRGEDSINTDTQLKARFNLEALPNYHIRLFPKNPNRYIKNSSRFYLKAICHMLKNRSKFEHNVVISRNTTFLPYLVYLRNCYNMSAIFESHGYHGNSSLPRLPSRAPRPLFGISNQYKYTERLFLNHINGLICITEPQAQLYQQDFPNIQITALPLGASTFHGEKQIPPNVDRFSHKKIFYTGRYTPHIHYRLIFESLSMVKDKSIRFVWMGLKEKDIQLFLPEVHKWGITDRVEFKEWMPHGEMKKLLDQQASVGLAAYRDTFRNEVVTSPSKIFDYLSSGLPVIAPNFRVIQSIIEHGRNGLLYTVDNAKSLARTIEEIFDDSKRYRRMCVNSLKSAERYSWKNRAMEILKFIERIR